MGSLKRNITLYGFLKIFTKRVFLPLTTVYLVEVGGLSLTQIAILAAVSAVVSICAEIPTGYFADRFTRKGALMAVGLFCAIGTLILVVFPGFHGALVAICFEAIGYSFLNGAGEALIYDTLEAMDESDNYPKVAGRAQSFGLIGNTVLVGLVPLTYSIDKRLPFLFGTIAYMTLFLIAHLMKEPPRPARKKLHVNPLKDLLKNLHVFVFKASLPLFLTIGILGALNFTSADFTNLVFKDLGLTPSFLGFVFAASSIAGIIGGYFIHLMKSLTLRNYALVDTVIFSSFFLAVGITRNLYVAIGGFVIYMGWWRLRQIMYQYHLMNMYKKTAYKATLISSLWFFVRGNEIWLPFAFVAIINAVGFYTGYIWIGALAAIILMPSFVFSTWLLSRHFQKLAKP